MYKRILFLIVLITFIVTNTFVSAEVKEEQIISRGIVDSPSDPKFANNIKNAVKALEYLNGKVVKPGEIFSFNKTVGKRTIERGFVEGLSGSGGYYYPDVGGGVCQAATALYRAALN
ncbi:VanW family protein [Thermoanaerobacter sp. RKWS2]|nr:VanW family protein [Thermoanaerobacter sp. RKWS2]UZQ81756.1 VanW family protein [Thermoanaerobacter sp. RKWS2]